MIALTPEAAAQIQNSANESQAGDMSLRLAVNKNPDGTLQYGMGFDETKEEDVLYTSEGITLIFAPQYAELLQGTTIDFVELEPGSYNFIFLNPNDANYTPPQESQGGGCPSAGNGCSGCG